MNYFQKTQKTQKIGASDFLIFGLSDTLSFPSILIYGFLQEIQTTDNR